MTMRCALSQSPFPAHHSACNSGASAFGGTALDKLRLNAAGVIVLAPPPLGREASGGVFDHLTEREQRLLVERPADELQTERQALAVEACRHGDAGKSRHVHRHGEHVVEIHLDRIRAALLAKTE